jgi:hypothetical protein
MSIKRHFPTAELGKSLQVASDRLNAWHEDRVVGELWRDGQDLPDTRANLEAEHGPLPMLQQSEKGHPHATTDCPQAGWVKPECCRLLTRQNDFGIGECLAND